MKREQQKHYQRLRKQGERATRAWRDAHALALWDNLEALGMVSSSLEPDEGWSLGDLTGDMFNPDVNTDIQPSRLERERDEFLERCDREGVWAWVGWFRLPEAWTNETIHACSAPVVWAGKAKGLCIRYGQWQCGACIGGIIGDEADDHPCIPDIKGETIRMLRESLAARCAACRKPLSSADAADAADAAARTIAEHWTHSAATPE